MRPDSEPERRAGVETEKVAEALVIRLAGQIDDLQADAVGARLDEVLEAGHIRIVFDLGEVLFMGSSGLGQIMRAYKAVKMKGGCVRIVNPQPLIAEVLGVTKLDRLLKVYPSLEEALQDLQ